MKHNDEYEMSDLDKLVCFNTQNVLQIQLIDKTKKKYLKITMVYYL